MDIDNVYYFRGKLMKNNQKIVLKLNREIFSSTRKPLIEGLNFSIEADRYNSGVEALRLKIGEGEVVWLPFLAGEVWDWSVGGVSQKFDGFVPDPAYGLDFLRNYGAFLIHCGLLSMGNPTAEDSHPQHGELPTSIPKSAWVEIDNDNEEFPVALCCSFKLYIPFEAAYTFTPKIFINKSGTNMVVKAQIENNFFAPLNYQYLAHINFHYPQMGRLNYMVKPFDSDSVEFLEKVIPGVDKDPSRLLPLSKKMIYDPEEVAIFDHANKAKSTFGDGRYALTTMESGKEALYWVVSDTKVLDHTVTWITQTPDRSACGFALPATGGPTGLANETRKGTIKQLAGKESVTLWYAFGASTPEAYLKEVTKALTQSE